MYLLTTSMATMHVKIEISRICSCSMEYIYDYYACKKEISCIWSSSHLML